MRAWLICWALGADVGKGHEAGPLMEGAVSGGVRSVPEEG